MKYIQNQNLQLYSLFGKSYRILFIYNWWQMNHQRLISRKIVSSEVLRTGWLIFVVIIHLKHLAFIHWGVVSLNLLFLSEIYTVYSKQDDRACWGCVHQRSVFLPQECVTPIWGPVLLLIKANALCLNLQHSKQNGKHEW